MATYRFVTIWRFKVPAEQVFDALNSPETYMEWWPNIVGYRKLNPEVQGVGAQAERAVRGALPYTLRYTTTVTHFDPGREVRYTAAGDLDGDGSFLVAEDARETVVTFHWNVATRGRWMNWLAPLLRGLFAWNHNYVMANGERGLASWLEARQLAAERT